VISLLPIHGLPLIQPGDLLADMLAERAHGIGGFQTDDILVVAQKIVSKAEGRIVRLDEIRPSQRAVHLAAQADKDPRLVELILRESREVVRVRPGLIVVEDVRGFICANAGIDRSNIEQHGEGEEVALLPADPDASALRLRQRIGDLTGVEIGVVINDSHGRAFRQGIVGVAIGLAGVPALRDRRGDPDLTGYILRGTVIATADEIAAAASLLMGGVDEAIPAVIVRGAPVPRSHGRASELQRPRETDLFR
jgi:coenzyme F420-0:L-glutamate ligase/coenzyme F420-1:gamma-L-glutamate ligase